MWGIVGFVNIKESSKKTIQALKKLNFRGLDGCGIYDGSNILTSKKINELNNSNQDSEISFGHVLHSIEGEVLQPIKEKGILCFNGEIYNYKDLNKKLNIETSNDSQTLLRFLDSNKDIKETLKELDGDYAFSYFNDEKIYLARDIIGVKPLWYHLDDSGSFEFASEKKVLHEKAIELNPREILIYDVKNKNFEIINREFKYPENESILRYENIKKDVWDLLVEAVKKRIPSSTDKKIGLLFSGGIDSTAIALVLQHLKIDFTCYTAKIEGNNMEEAQDLIYSIEISEKHNLNLEVAKTTIKELEEHTIEVMKLIESNDYIKVSVALPFYLACERAKKDKIDIMFSGLGSEEIFAGYRRHKQAQDPNKECFEGLKIMHLRDLYRDDVITMNFTQELRVPFLDKNLIDYSLKIPEKYKLDLKKIEEIKDRVYGEPHLNSEVRSKIVLRDVIRDKTTLEEKYIERQKKAAQYGSKFDKGLLRLAKNTKINKQEYLDQLWGEKINKKLPIREKY